MFGARQIPSGRRWNPNRVRSAAVFDGGYLERTFANNNGDTWSCVVALLSIGSSADQSVLSRASGSNARWGLSSGRNFQFNDDGAAVRNSNETVELGTYTLFLVTGNGTENRAYTSSGEEFTFAAVNNIADLNVNTLHRIGADSNAGRLFYGAMAQFIFIDGQELTPADVWDLAIYGTNGQQYVPKPDAVMEALALAAGGNSFALTDLISTGQDSSGLGNHWTVVGSVSETANTPSHPHAIFNSLNHTGEISNGGRRFTGGNGTNLGGAVLTQPMAAGKWSLEFVYNGGNLPTFGIVDEGYQPKTNVRAFQTANATGQNIGQYSTAYFNNGVLVESGKTSIVTVSRVRMEFDVDAGQLTYFVNNQFDGVISSIPQDTWFFFIGDGSTSGVIDVTINVDETNWIDTPTTDFKSLTIANLPTPDVQGADVFNAMLYAGDGQAGRAVTALGHEPDLLWLKERGNTQSHAMYSRLVDDFGSLLSTNNTDAAVADTRIASVGADGWTFGVTVSAVNEVGRAYVAWSWVAGGAVVANNDGTIASQVSVHPSGHFSIVEYMGSGGNASVGHGLSDVPDLIIIRNRDKGTYDWVVWATGFSPTERLLLNLSSAVNAGNWYASHTSSVFHIGTHLNINEANDRFIAYLFKSVPGLLTIGRYAGNGLVNGPYIHCGFRPRWVMIKRIDGADNWVIFDTVRDLTNPLGRYLLADTTNAEATFSTVKVDATSGGFKLRNTANSINNSSGEYLYMAMADIAGGGDLPPIYGR